MEKFPKVIIEDLEVYKKGLDKKNYQFCNVISNRITMNSVFLESKEFALIGGLLKDILPNFQKLEEEDENKARRELIKIIDIYIKNIENLDCVFIIDKYSEYYDTFKQCFNSSIEKYTENKDYTSKVINYCLSFLKKELDEDSLPLSEDLLTSGVLNEISRITRSFGCTTHQHMLKLVLSFFSKLRDYFKVLLLSDETENVEWSNRHKTHIGILKENITNYELSDGYIERCLDDLYVFIKEWRLMFMRFMNIIPQIPQQVRIPSRIDSELKNLVSKAVSKEIKGEKE